MASSEPPKEEDKGKGMLKKEALDARVTELSTSLQEMMADGETSDQESSANETPLMTHRTDPSRSAPTDGLRRRESYCLLGPAEILKWMDMSYNASVDFRDLNARLCGLKQQKLLMELLQQDGRLEQLKEWPSELALKFE